MRVFYVSRVFNIYDSIFIFHSNGVIEFRVLLTLNTELLVTPIL